MSRIDDAIRQSLASEDAALLDKLGADQPLTTQLLETFQGRLAWMNISGWIAGFALAALLAYCGWRFVTATDDRDMLLWLAGGGLACAGMMLVKIWFWLELQKNAVVRELKRLELQVARLTVRE